MNGHQNSRTGTLSHLWWLAPAMLFCLVVGSTMLAAEWQSDAAYRLYGAPKFVDLKHLLLAAAAILAFGIGSQLAWVTGPNPELTSKTADRYVWFWFWTATGLTLFGYAIWFVVGVKNGFTLGLLREYLTTDDPSLNDTIRTEMFSTVQGITTCTQFGIAAVPLGLWLLFRGERKVSWALILLVGMAATRALVFSERLALIELLVPAFIVTLRMGFLGRRIAPTTRWILQIAPLMGVAALIVLFAGLEYFRSWRYYQHEFDSYAEFALWRMAGYYTTAHNNGAMALETQEPYPLPYITLLWLWKFPGIGNSPLGYTALTGLDPVARHLAMLEQIGTPELNNEGGLLQPALDYGLGGFVVFWFGCGFVASKLYRNYLAGNLAGVTIYPLVFLAILETPRLLYLCYPRSFPAMVTLLLVTIFAHSRSRVTVPLAASPTM